MFTEQLKEIGLTEKEAVIYTTLLKHGAAPASRIAASLGYDRTTTYYILLQMVDKGFVSERAEDGKKQFAATDPQKILLILKERQDNFAHIIPQLHSLVTTANDVKVEVLKGKTAIQRLYKEVINDKEELLDFGVDEEKFLEYGGTAFQQYIQLVKKGKMKERLLTQKGKKLLGNMSRYRFIDEQYFSPLPTTVFGNKIALISWEPTLQIILIENALLAESFRKRFELLWKIAEKA